MAHRIQPGGTRRFERLSRLERFDVEEGDVDPRGWSVTTPGGESLGEVKDLIIDTERMRGTYLDVELDTKQFDLRDDPHVLVPVERAHRDRNHRRLVVEGLARERVLDLVAEREAAATAFWDRWWGRHETTGELPPLRNERGSHVDPHPQPEPQRVNARVTPPPTPSSAQPVREPVGPGDIGRAVDQVAPGQTVRIPVVREEIVIERRPVADSERLVAREDGPEHAGDAAIDRLDDPDVRDVREDRIITGADRPRDRR